jgi:hypothetical protein
MIESLYLALAFATMIFSYVCIHAANAILLVR